MRSEEVTRSGGLDGRTGLVCVSRDEDDPRTVLVDVRELFGWHVTRRAGGRKARLSRPMRAAIMPCSLIPPGVDFGHDGVHGPCPHPIKVLIREES